MIAVNYNDSSVPPHADFNGLLDRPAIQVSPVCSLGVLPAKSVDLLFSTIISVALHTMVIIPTTFEEITIYVIRERVSEVALKKNVVRADYELRTVYLVHDNAAYHKAPEVRQWLQERG